MRILLVSIINSYKYGNTGVDYIAHYVRELKCTSVDVKYYHNQESYDEIINDIPLTYEIYGFSVFETNYLLLKKICEHLKKNKPDAIIVFGGQFVTMNYNEIIQDGVPADYFIVGDGESPFRRIVEHHRASVDLLTDDDNIATAKSTLNKKINTEDHTRLEESFDYFTFDSFNRNQNKTHCMMTKSNICTGACSFCCSRKGSITYKSNQKIIDEIKYLATECGVRKFFFCDDDIFDIDCDENRNRLHELFDGILQLNLNIVFSGFAKAKPICNPKNYELLEKMNAVGFHHLFLGIDAGNEFDRTLYNKRSSLDEGILAVQIMNNIGISPRYGMIFINPYTSIESMRASYRYLLKLKSTNYYHYGGLRVQLLNGTRLLKKVRADGLLDTGCSFMNTDAYHYSHPEITPIVDFLNNEFIPRADSVKHQFNTLKRKYELVRHLNPQAEVFDSFISQYEKIEFENLKQFFHQLFEESNVAHCRAHLDQFITSMEANSVAYTPVIQKLSNIFSTTPINK